MKSAPFAIAVFLWIGICFTACMSGDNDKTDRYEAPDETDTRAVLEGEIDVVTWWVSPGEVEALQALVDVFNTQYTGLDLINILSIEGGVNAVEAEVSRRFEADNPPVLMQSLPTQYHRWITEGKIEPLDSLYESEGWFTSFPQAILDEVTENDVYYGVPVGLHRTNTLLYNPLIVEDPPKTLEELISLVESLRDRGIRPITVDNGNGHEFILDGAFAASTGIDFFAAFTAGKIDVFDEDNESTISAALDDAKRLMEATDWETTIELDWEEAAELFFSGDAAMYINGDWVSSYLVSLGATPGIDFQATAVPGTQGLFHFALDTFVLCRGTEYQENGIDFLKIMGSPEGEAAFCMLKGATPLLGGVSTEGWDDVAIRTYEDYRDAEYLVLSGSSNYAIPGLSEVIMGYVNGTTSNARTIDLIQSLYKTAPQPW